MAAWSEPPNPGPTAPSRRGEAFDVKDDSTYVDDVLEGEEGLDLGAGCDYPAPDVDVKVSRDQYSLFEINRMVNETRDLIVAPDFQRNSVWKEKQKRELIETILLGIPIPVIYLFENEKGVKQLVDGKQRVDAITGFMANKLALQDLKLLSLFNGKKFKDLDPKYKSKFERYQITVYVVEPPTPERVKYDIFDRVNRGGTKLNSQEMRNAIYFGKSTEFIGKLAKSESFLNATGGGISSKRMKDQYVVLRFLSFYMLQENKIVFEYRSNVDDLFASVMKHLNGLSDRDLNELERVFTRAMDNSLKILGGDGFRFAPRDENKNRRPINMVLFEALGCFFASFDISLIDKLNLKDEVDRLKSEYDKSGYFKNSVDSTDSVRYRFDKIQELKRRLGIA